MPFRVIRGTFHVLGYSPDGDSIRFRAENETMWNLLGCPAVRLNGKRHAQLRLEGIDTLETHFLNFHQPPALAIKALDFLLHELGITGVVWDTLLTRITEANDGTPGYIVSRTAEEYGRPVAFAFAGTPAEADGASLFLTPARMQQSINAKSLAEGLAYPTYYRGLFHDLRSSLTRSLSTARASGLNIWAEDKTNTGFDVSALASITDEHVILPKLFRRLAEFLQAGGSVVGFREFLEAGEEGITILSTGHSTHFDTIVTVTGTNVRMTEPPENVVFDG
jgi:endonuclease YncB( thermonuclease family)